ncbi:hypothetical protein FQN54_004720 [Arachnomyces sp. PD_36]|nr:hypothetical protein FQN54_004720 [Arachnomyces sp. PD_36]
MPPKRKPSVSSPTRPKASAPSRQTKKTVTSTTTTTKQAVTGSGIPFPLRLLLGVLTSLGLSSLLYSLSTEVTAGDLALISKRLDTWWGVGGLVTWRAVELSAGWFLGYDGRDVASIILLSHLPTFNLLSTFYAIRPTTVLASFAITLFSTTFPFVFLHRTNPVHQPRTAAQGTISNRAILTDKPTTIYTILAATSIYSVFLYVSFATWLPVHLVSYFDGIRDLRTAHSGPAGLPLLLLNLLPAGYAARDFLFVSSTGTSQPLEPKPSSKDGQGELLFTSLYRKTWGQLPVKTRTLISRTLVLSSMVMLNTIVQVAGTIEGAELYGAVGWGGIWSLATLVIGLTFHWIEDVEGV